MLKYVGHPFVDVGIATIAAFVGKSDPASVTETDLDQIANYISREYVVDPLKSFLNVAFPNSGYTQPAYEKTPGKRTEYADRVLRSYRADVPTSEDRCVFTGAPAADVSFSVGGKLPPGRAYRQHIPGFMGEGIINCYPGGDAGLPVSGEALLCIQAFPVGCAKCGGRLLAVHSDNPEITWRFAHDFLDYNRHALSLAHAAGSKKMTEASASPRTLLVDTLLKLDQERVDRGGTREPCSVTAYHFSNSGQSNPLDRRSPPLEIYHLPLEITDFLGVTVEAAYRHDWEAIAQRAWRISTPKKQKGDDTKETEDTTPRRNLLYEDLFRLPDNAPIFIRRYLLRIPIRSRFEDDPRRGYSLRDEANLVSWKLTNLLLERALRMNSKRIEEIRRLGDRLADFVADEDDKRFFQTFFSVTSYDYLRNALIKANHYQVRRGKPPLITLDPFIEIFEDGDEIASPTWKLSRDLVLIRMVEQLHSRGWLAKNREAIPDTSDEAESQ